MLHVTLKLSMKLKSHIEIIKKLLIFLKVYNELSLTVYTL